MEFQLLGPLTIVIDGKPVEPGPPKQRAVLAVLLLNANEVVPTDRLIDLVWSDNPPRTAEHSVQIYVSSLRKLLHNGTASIETRPPGYLLKADPAAIDVIRFEHLIGEGLSLMQSEDPHAAAGTLQQALSLWTGNALSDFTYEEFAQPHIRRLEDLRATAEEELAAAELELGGAQTVIPRLERIIRDHPLRERPHELYMRALYRQGRQADALRAYQAARQRLGGELGIEPSPELQRLEELILQQDPSLEIAQGKEAPRRGNLPAEMNSFVGRDREVRDIRRLLEASRLVTLLGVGGVGKSRLAVHTARSLAESFQDGAWLIDLSGVTDPAHVAPTVGSVWRIPPEPDGTGRALSASLRDRQLLLVLDNCERVAEGVALLAEEVLAAAPELKILATSREPLESRGEVLWRVAPLELPDVRLAELSEHELEQYAAIRLFYDRARSVAPDFQWDHRSAVQVARICALLEGIPLAIELAAARVRSMTLAEIEAGFDDRFSLLVGGGRATPGRHRALAATIDWSYELLDPHEREFFGRLGVFRQSFPLAGAEVICGGEGIDDADVRDLLGRLVDRSLVIHEERAGESWYTMPDSLRAYAFEKITQGHAHVIQRGFFLTLAQQTDPALRGPEDGMWAALLDGERQTVRTALETATYSWREEQGTFLAGVAAASATRSGHIGFLGGANPESPGNGEDQEGFLRVRRLIARWRHGFTAGLNHVDPNLELHEAYLTDDEDFMAAFSSPARGREKAIELYAQGCDVVLHAAGQSGRRIFEAARRASEDGGSQCWGIGADYDEYLLQPDVLTPYVLGSVVKQVPIDIFREFKDAYMSGEPDRAPHFDLGNEAIHLSTRGGYLDRVAATLERIRRQILSGELDVGGQAGSA